jgi:CRISPR-associated protein Cas2
MAYFVVAYDISSNKRRKKIGDALEAYGKRVNYSVFEIQLGSKSQKSVLEKELLKLIEPKTDSLRFYHVCENCMKKSWSLGEEAAPFEEDAVYYF